MYYQNYSIKLLLGHLISTFTQLSVRYMKRGLNALLTNKILIGPQWKVWLGQLFFTKIMELEYQAKMSKEEPFLTDMPI